MSGHLLLDPTTDEEHQQDGSLMLAMMPQANLVSRLASFSPELWQAGSMSAVSDCSKRAPCHLSDLREAPKTLCLQVTQVLLTGEWSNSDCTEAIELCMGGCSQLDEVLRQHLRTKVLDGWPKTSEPSRPHRL